MRQPRHWSYYAKYDEVADIIVSQMHLYIAEGKMEKAMKLVARIRRLTLQRAYA